MNATELRELSAEALNEKLEKLSQEAFNLRFQQATAQLENTVRIRDVRRDIARIKTVLGETSKAEG